MRGKGVAVGAEGAGHLQNPGISQGLLHAVADSVLVILGLHYGNGNSRLVIQHVVGELFLLFISRRQVAPNHYGPRGQGHFTSDLGHLIPAGRGDGRGDEQIANISLAQVLFIDIVQIVTSCCLPVLGERL